MYYIQLYHQLLILLTFDIVLLRYMFVLQILHPILQFYILMCLNHLVLYIHNFLLNLYVLMDNHLNYMLAFQIFCQNVPM